MAEMNTRERNVRGQFIAPTDRGERDRQIIALYCENNTLAVVAERYRLTHQGVSYILRQNNISVRRSTPKPKPPKFGRKRITSIERFWSKVDKSAGVNECWPWVGKAKHKHGYGSIYFKNKYWYAHHLAWFLTYHSKATKWHLHDCGNAMCCNPSHIYDGTPTENARDRQRHGTHRHGERHGQAKLTDDKVRQIYVEANLPIRNQSKIAKRENVDQSTIHAIKYGKAWKGVTAAL